MFPGAPFTKLANDVDRRIYEALTLVGPCPLDRSGHEVLVHFCELLTGVVNTGGHRWRMNVAAGFYEFACGNMIARMFY